MNEAVERITRQIVKLMALGDPSRNSNAEQVRLANEKVAELMAKYSISFEQLRADKPSDDIFATVYVDGTSDIKVDYEAQLAGHIAYAFDCKVINTNRNGYWQLAFCGAKHDIEIAVYFFRFLQRTISSMARLKFPKDVRNSRRNYCLGLVTTVGTRLEDIYKRRDTYIPADCKALVLRKKEGLEDYFRKQFPYRTAGRQLRLRGNMEAFAQGRQDGKKIPLSRPIPYGGNSNGAVLIS